MQTFPSELVKPYSLDLTNSLAAGLLNDGVGIYISDDNLATVINAVNGTTGTAADITNHERGSPLGDFRIGFDYSARTALEQEELDADPYQLFQVQEDELLTHGLKGNGVDTHALIDISTNSNTAPKWNLKFKINDVGSSIEGLTDSFHRILGGISVSDTENRVIVNGDGTDVRFYRNNSVYRWITEQFNYPDTVIEFNEAGNKSGIELLLNGVSQGVLSQGQAIGCDFSFLGVNFDYYFDCFIEFVAFTNYLEPEFSRYYDCNQTPAETVVPELINGQHGTLVNFKSRGGIVNGTAQLRPYTYLDTTSGDGARSALLEDGMTQWSVYFEALRLNSISQKTLIIGCSYPGFYIQQRNAAGGITISAGSGDKHAFFNYPVDGEFHSFLARFDAVAGTVTFFVDEVQVYQLTGLTLSYSQDGVDGSGVNHRIKLNGWMHIDSDAADRDVRGIVRVWDESNDTGFEWDFNNAFDTYVPESSGKHGLNVRQIENSGFVPLVETNVSTAKSDGTADYVSMVAWGQDASIANSTKHEALLVKGSVVANSIADHFGYRTIRGASNVHGAVSTDVLVGNISTARNAELVRISSLVVNGKVTPVDASPIQVEDCWLKSNDANSYGVNISGVRNATFRNVLFTGYKRAVDGASSNDLSIKLFDCTFVGNKEYDVVRAYMQNCILASTTSAQNLIQINGTSGNNISLDDSAAASGVGVQKVDINTAFADPTSGDYRIKQSYADANLVGTGWNGSDIAGWAYYDDSAEGGASPEDVVYTIQLTGIDGRSVVDKTQLTKDSLVQLSAVNASVSAATSFLRKDSMHVLDSMSASLEAQRLAANVERRATLSGVQSSATFGEVYAQKDWVCTLAPINGELNVTTNQLTREYAITANGIKATLNGVAMNLTVDELGVFTISLKGFTAKAKAPKIEARVERAIELAPFNASQFGVTMYVNVDRLIKANGINSKSLVAEKSLLVEREARLSGVNASGAINSAYLLFDKQATLGSAYAQAYFYGLTMSSTAAMVLSKTNTLSGYTVSFETSPVSVIFEFNRGK